MPAEMIACRRQERVPLARVALQRRDVAPGLAYAMAHEMGHLLLPFPAHADAGIMRSGWNGDDLRHMANGSLQFTPAQTAALRLKASTCCAP
jgi:hypothetical protein